MEAATAPAAADGGNSGSGTQHRCVYTRPSASVASACGLMSLHWHVSIYLPRAAVPCSLPHAGGTTASAQGTPRRPARLMSTCALAAAGRSAPSLTCLSPPVCHRKSRSRASTRRRRIITRPAVVIAEQRRRVVVVLAAAVVAVGGGRGDRRRAAGLLLLLAMVLLVVEVLLPLPVAVAAMAKKMLLVLAPPLQPLVGWQLPLAALCRGPAARHP